MKEELKLAKWSAAPSLFGALEACLDFIRSEYWSEEAIAWDGHPIAREARKVWERGWDAMNEAMGQ